MGDLKEHQPPMTIDEQVENLKSIGLIVNDEEYAKRILNDISYFRLVKAYSDYSVRFVPRIENINTFNPWESYR